MRLSHDQRARAREREATTNDPKLARAYARAEAILRARPTAKRNRSDGRPRYLTRRLRRPEAVALIKHVLARVGWRPDDRAAPWNDVWISPKSFRRVTFPAEGQRAIRFEIGGRGAWDRDSRVHDWGGELTAVAYAHRLIGGALTLLRERGGGILPDWV